MILLDIDDCLRSSKDNGQQGRNLPGLVLKPHRWTNLGRCSNSQLRLLLLHLVHGIPSSHFSFNLLHLSHAFVARARFSSATRGLFLAPCEDEGTRRLPSSIVYTSKLSLRKKLLLNCPEMSRRNVVCSRDCGRRGGWRSGVPTLSTVEKVG